MPDVVFDANFLSILFDPAAGIPADPVTKKPIERAQEKIECLIQALQDAKATLVIPSPALAEFLILVHPDGGKYLKEIKGSFRFEIADFDEMAAIELAELSARTAKPKRNKRAAKTEETWAKLKYDRQILCIALSRGAKTLYSTDGHLLELAVRNGIEGVGLADLPPPPPKQLEFDAINEVLASANVVRIDKGKAAQEPQDEPASSGKS